MGAPAGNQNAKVAKRWQSAITRALAKISEGQGVEAGLDKLADQLVQAAVKGEQWAMLEVGNRLDGKPAQIIAGDDDLPPVGIAQIERTIVRPNPPATNS